MNKRLNWLLQHPPYGTIHLLFRGEEKIVNAKLSTAWVDKIRCFTHAVTDHGWFDEAIPLPGGIIMRLYYGKSYHSFTLTTKCQPSRLLARGDVGRKAPSRRYWQDANLPRYCRITRPGWGVIDVTDSHFPELNQDFLAALVWAIFISDIICSEEVYGVKTREIIDMENRGVTGKI